MTWYWPLCFFYRVAAMLFRSVYTMRTQPATPVQLPLSDHFDSLSSLLVLAYVFLPLLAPCSVQHGSAQGFAARARRRRRQQQVRGKKYLSSKVGHAENKDDKYKMQIVHEWVDSAGAARWKIYTKEAPMLIRTRTEVNRWGEKSKIIVWAEF